MNGRLQESSQAIYYSEIFQEIGKWLRDHGWQCWEKLLLVYRDDATLALVDLREGKFTRLIASCPTGNLGDDAKGNDLGPTIQRWIKEDGLDVVTIGGPAAEALITLITHHHLPVNVSGQAYEIANQASAGDMLSRAIAAVLKKTLVPAPY